MLFFSCLQKTFLYFTQANLPALRTKLLQLNDELAQSPVSPLFQRALSSASLTSSYSNPLQATSALALSAEEIPLVDLLLAAAGASSTKTPDDKTAAVLVKLLQWPSSHVFPCTSDSTSLSWSPLLTADSRHRYRPRSNPLPSRRFARHCPLLTRSNSKHGGKRKGTRNKHDARVPGVC